MEVGVQRFKLILATANIKQVSADMVTEVEIITDSEVCSNMVPEVGTQSDSKVGTNVVTNIETKVVLIVDVDPTP